MDGGPRGWAEPLYARVLDDTGVGPATRVLDVGCGPGDLARAALVRGAAVRGVDSDPSVVAFAAVEVPGAAFAVGDAHDLGAVDPADVVTLVQVIAHVANPVKVLREAARVAPGGRVAVTVWGRESECDVRAFGEALAPWLPPRRPPAGPPPLTEPDRLRRLVELAGLEVAEVAEVVCPFTYPDEDSVLQPLARSGIGRHAARAVGPGAFRDAVLARLAPHRTADGGFRLENLFRVLVATPPPFDAASSTGRRSDR